MLVFDWIYNYMVLTVLTYKTVPDSSYVYFSNCFTVFLEVHMSYSNHMDDEFEKFVRRMNPPR